MAIRGRIQQQNQLEEDREELLHLGSWEAGLDYHWRGDVAGALIKGWSGSSQIKKTCLEALQKGGQNEPQLDRELALRILLEGYPQDPDVADYFVQEIRGGGHFGLSLFESWQLVAQNFKDHPKIVAAIEDWLPTQQYMDPQVAFAASVGRTPQAKAKLLSLLDSSSVPHWAAGSLIEGWGITDTAVREKLTEIVFGPAVRASRIAYLFPQIIEDKNVCRKKLLELLQNTECIRPDFVMSGLGALGVKNDSEVVNVILDLIRNRLDRDDLNQSGVIAEFIIGHSQDPRVRELAKGELLERNGAYTAVAIAYGEDEEIRQRIIEIACPLSTHLRKVIASRMGERIVDEEFALSLLNLYDSESDPAVKVQASIAYHLRLKASGQNTESAIESLSRNIVCYGSDYKERRQAAFCGLSLLNRLDLMLQAQERIGSDKRCAISISNAYSPNIPLLKYILQNWNNIQTALGDEFWLRMTKWESDPLEFWSQLCLFADEYPSPRDETLHFIEERAERTEDLNIFHFLSKVRPKSHLLLQYCFKTLRIGDDQRDCSGEEAVAAAEILGEHFGGDSDILAQITQGKAQGLIYEKVLLALCEGWPQSEQLEQMFQTLRRDKRSLTYDTYFRVICGKGKSKVVCDALTKVLSECTRFPQRRLDRITRPVLRRLRTDDELLEMLVERLKNNPTPSEKATFPRLISAARGLSTELRTWCIKELDEQLNESSFPEVGFDLVANDLRPISHSLMEMLDQSQTMEL